MTTTKTKRRPAMVQLNLKVPEELLDKLARRANDLSKKTGLRVVPSAVARAILEEHA